MLKIKARHGPGSEPLRWGHSTCSAADNTGAAPETGSAFPNHCLAGATPAHSCFAVINYTDVIMSTTYSKFHVRCRAMTETYPVVHQIHATLPCPGRADPPCLGSHIALAGALVAGSGTSPAGAGCLYWQVGDGQHECQGKGLFACVSVCDRPWFSLAVSASRRRQPWRVQQRLLNTHAVAKLMQPTSAWHFQQKLAASKHSWKPTHCPRKPTRQKAALAEIRLYFPTARSFP